MSFATRSPPADTTDHARPAPVRSRRRGARAASRRSATSAPSTTSTSRCAAARSSASSAPTAPARPPCSRCSPRCCPSTAAAPRSSATTYAGSPHVVRQLLGVTGQYASVDENLTATENLMLFARLQGIDRGDGARHRRERCSSSSTSPRPRAKPIKAFSGGMRRRLDLAASLITRPPLIFLDEPTTGLDPRTRGQMWDTIRELVGQRLHRAAHHPVPRRGRPARRPDRGHRPRPQGRRRARPTSSRRRSAGPRCSSPSSTAPDSTRPPRSSSGSPASRPCPLPRGPAGDGAAAAQRPGRRHPASPCATRASPSTP